MNTGSKVNLATLARLKSLEALSNTSTDPRLLVVVLLCGCATDN